MSKTPTNETQTYTSPSQINQQVIQINTPNKTKQHKSKPSTHRKTKTPSQHYNPNKRTTKHTNKSVNNQNTNNNQLPNKQT